MGQIPRDGRTLPSEGSQPACASRYVLLRPSRNPVVVVGDLPGEPLMEPGGVTDVDLECTVDDEDFLEDFEEDVETEVRTARSLEIPTPRQPLATIPDREDEVATEVRNLATTVRFFGEPSWT